MCTHEDAAKVFVMKILVVGATGATGRLLVEQLLDKGLEVKAIVRSPDKLPEAVRQHENISISQASLLDLSDEEMIGHVKDCDAIASCLGHNLTFKGMYGQPRKLVTDATRRLCDAVKGSLPEKTVKFVLMNTAGNNNRDLDEKVSFAENAVLGFLRLALPPHPDNEGAADYLRTEVNRGEEVLEWVVVRPDSLISEDSVSEYEVHPSPTRSALFNPGKTSRINVAHFMAELISNEETWQTWKWQMPVIYNRGTAQN